MKKIGETIIRCIMYFSFQERKKRELKEYREEKKRIGKMEVDEAELEYIDLKVEYQHIKNVLSVFLLAILISVLMDVWNIFYTFIERITQYAASFSGKEAELANVMLVVLILVIVFITLAIFMILIAHTKRMRQVYKKLMAFGEIRNRINNG